MAGAQKDVNDPFESHKKGGAWGSIWGGKQPAKIAAPAQATPKAYKEESKLPAPPSFARLFFFPMAYFIITALSFTILWEINKVVPFLIGLVMLSTVFDFSSLGDPKNLSGADINGWLPALSGPGAMKAMRIWLHIVVAWLAVFLGGVTGINADEAHMSAFYAITFGREYENVLASTPGAAYSDAGKVRFATTSTHDVSKSVGFKDKFTFCAAPILDENQGANPVAFWAIGYDCCDGRGNFKCGAHDNSARGGVRAPPDGVFHVDHGMFLRAVNQSAAVNKLTIDEDVILLHWVEDPDSEAVGKLFAALAADFIGAGLFALLVLFLTALGLYAEHEYTMKSSHHSLSEDLT